ncbi:TPA-induced transmembrane protein [Pygocentrus nattereri]|uniref:SEA domain-containing protein n=1 Tax=Pygocentrus nattereri TaxID=42514 RepID=A0A3B4C043_PYGNA|nr:TPA-induced transmembrane protein [Pygocentrus nattereri]
MDDLELKCLDEVSDNNNVENGEMYEEVSPGNGTCSSHHASDITEGRPLLTSAQVAENNGDHCSVRCPTLPETKPRVLERLKKELNETVVWKIKVWMAILIAFVFIVSVILLFLFLCSDHQEDVDDQYDASSFVVPLFFRGSFTLANQSFVQDSTPQPNLDDGLPKNLQQKLTDIYKSSHALERYFSLATINTLRNASVQYQLQFKMPLEHEQLTHYTLSREVVYHVLLQHLLDQDTENSLYIEPSSLNMEVGKWN